MKTPLEKVGAFLREARTGRSLSLEELSSSLRIGKEQLSALECGQEELLPEKVFVKAMVRRVSEKLNLDTNFILQELEGRDISVEEIFENNNERILRPNISLVPIYLVLSGIAGILLSMIFINLIEDKIFQAPESTTLNSKEKIITSFNK